MQGIAFDYLSDVPPDKIGFGQLSGVDPMSVMQKTAPVGNLVVVELVEDHQRDQSQLRADAFEQR